MFSFKSVKREFLARLMTILGFGGMVAFCMPSCEQTDPNRDKQPVQELNDKIDSVQNVIESDKTANPNDDKQSDMESNDKTDSVQNVIESDKTANPNDDNQPGQELNDNTDDIQPIADSGNEPNHYDQVRYEPKIAIKPSEYGIRQPVTIPLNPPEVPPWKKLRNELSDLNRKIQSSCHIKDGTLLVEFDFDSTGKASNMRTSEGSLKDTKAETCILSALSNHQFSTKVDKTNPVKYIFEFGKNASKSKAKEIDRNDLLADLSKELSALNKRLQSRCNIENGILNVEFQLDTSGKVMYPKALSGSLKDTESETCVINKLSKHQFSSKITSDLKQVSIFKFNYSFIFTK